MSQVFDTFLRVDQTGAIGAGGKPKPLQACLLQRESSRRNGAGPWRLEPVRLAGLGCEEVRALLGERFGRSALIVDSVFGLPSACLAGKRGAGGELVWKLLREAAAEPGYGRAASERFFSGLLPARGRDPLAGAPWVFEGFPTLVWRRLFGFPARRPEAAVELVAREGWIMGLQPGA